MAKNQRIRINEHTSAIEGDVVWDMSKALWFIFMGIGGAIGLIFFFTWQGFAIFIISTALTICLGHSIGMHRLLIHRSFACHKWLEYILVYLGTLVSMAGPFGMMRLHDFRDWSQNLPYCHSFSKHDAGFWRDCFWQLQCKHILKYPPEYNIEEEVYNDKFYRFLEKTWRWQQLPWALFFFFVAGWSGLLLGICLRIFVSLTGHWLIGYFAHQEGDRSYTNKNIAVDGRNIPELALITFGEAWHNNHHAYPASARLGHDKAQIDIGWWCIKLFAKLGWAWDLQVPAQMKQVHIPEYQYYESE